MDRTISYSGAVPLLDDFLNAQKNTMIALGTALQAILGTATLVDGLACAPTGPASLEVVVAPGSIYSIENVDGTAYGDIAADTTHQIIKQGIALDPTTLSCPAPVTTGNSINYLIQAAYQDQDTGSTVLPYFNAANPPVAYNGPANSGTSQNTIRKGAIVLSAKAGTSATTGTQTTPSPDAGYTGLWVVTVANGTTAIISGNISEDSGAPFIVNKLTALAPLASPALTGVPTVPTASPGTNTTQAASCAFVTTAVGGTGSTAQPEGGITHGRNIAWASNTTISVAASSIIMKNSSGQTVKASAPSATLNSASSGANGLDTGSVAINTLYYIYGIYNSSTSTFASLMSTSPSAPTLPSGYTYSALLSDAYTDGSGHFIGFTHLGTNWQYKVGSNLTGLPGIVSGTQGSTSTPTLVSASMSAVVPPNAASVLYVAQCRGNLILAPNNNYGPVGSTTNSAPVSTVNVGGQSESLTVEMVPESSNVYYASDGGASGSSGVFVLGFTLNI